MLCRSRAVLPRLSLPLVSRRSIMASQGPSGDPSPEDGLSPQVRGTGENLLELCVQVRPERATVSGEVYLRAKVQLVCRSHKDQPSDWPVHPGDDPKVLRKDYDHQRRSVVLYSVLGKGVYSLQFGDGHSRFDAAWQHQEG